MSFNIYAPIPHRSEAAQKSGGNKGLKKNTAARLSWESGLQATDFNNFLYPLGICRIGFLENFLAYSAIVFAGSLYGPMPAAPTAATLNQ